MAATDSASVAPMQPVVLKKAELPFKYKLGSGAVAGVIGTCIIYPIDTVKTYLMQNPGKYTGPIDCFKSRVGEAGVIGLYKGLPANLIGVTPEKAIKLGVNDFLRTQCAKYNAEHGIFGNAGDGLTTLQAIACGSTAGFAQSVATNPMELVKIRMQLAGLAIKAAKQELEAAAGQGEAAVAAATKHLATVEASNPTTIKGVVRRAGFFGLYHGIRATLLRDVPFSAMFFPLYGMLNSRFSEHGLAGTMAAGCTSGFISAVLATPMDVIKTRMQSVGGAERYTGVRDCARQVYSEAGAAAFFRGWLPRGFVVAPLFGISLMSYEIVKKVVREHEARA